MVAQLERVKNLPAPEFGSLQTWERANIGAFANGDPSAADSSRNSQGQYGTPMPYMGETMVGLTYTMNATLSSWLSNMNIHN